MGSLFRSDEMTLGQFYVQYEAAYSILAELGELGLVQFRDVNAGVPTLQKQFVNEIRRCEEMARILRLFETHIRSLDLPLPEPLENPRAPFPKEMIDMEASLQKMESELNEVSTNRISLNKTNIELLEFKNILSKGETIFSFDETPSFDSGDLSPLSPQPQAKETHLMGFIAGVILREKVASFETILWRLSRGNAHFRDIEIAEPFPDVDDESEEILKNVFVIFYQGDNLKLKIKKMCEAFHCSIYPCPESAEERKHLLDGVNVRIEDLKMIMNQTKDHQFRMLKEAAEHLQESFLKVNKMKAIFHTLNMFSNDMTRKCLIGEGWIPTADLTLVYNALDVATTKCGSTAPSIVNPLKSSEQPPTYNKTNKLTSGFQGIVNAYGVGSYQEVNPAPYTVISFPFLFAVMFGDAGHGIIMALFALFMVLKEKSLRHVQKDNEIWRTFFNGRYIILLMGLFSIYTGFIYNDMFALSTNIFGSSWSANNVTGVAAASVYQLNPAKDYRNNPYYFGIDPVWQLSSNKILYLNSYKMKLSVILGVCQMVFGVVLGIFNHFHFKQRINIVLEFIPQLIFLVLIFGYLDFLIIFKWFAYNSTQSNDAPSILISFINMFMFKESPEMFPGQEALQKAFVFLAVVCIPWMLLGKPIYLIQQHKKRFVPVENQEQHAEEFSVMDVFINQAIHTIEFCLGSISHTASYLRLWALSLAHAQLSEVLWTMVMRQALSKTTIMGAVMTVPVFAFWACLTLAILLLMEGLSAFLHAIRLHWVEFQSKFYHGAGYIFEPFTFKGLLDAHCLEA